MDPKDWHDELVALYCYLCEEYRTHLWVQVERLSPNDQPRFTDEEVLTVYFFGLFRQLRTLRAIHHYSQMHLSAWFPHLPCYGGFVQRLNRLSDLFPALLERILTQEAATLEPKCATYIVDTLPIVLAQQARSGRARVAREYADKGYCASKKQYYHGVKLQVLGQQRAGTLPRPESVLASPASQNDLTLLKGSASTLPKGELFADKIYADAPWQAELQACQQVRLRTPVKRKKGQKSLQAADRLYSAAVSRVRQPIESLFSWIQEKTGIQNASHVRSTTGLWVHVFGRFAAAMLLWILNP
jgi:hypothetical protein